MNVSCKYNVFLEFCNEDLWVFGLSFATFVLAETFVKIKRCNFALY